MVSASNAANANNNGNANNNTASNGNYVAAIKLFNCALAIGSQESAHSQVKRIKERHTFHGMVVNRQGDVP